MHTHTPSTAALGIVEPTGSTPRPQGGHPRQSAHKRTRSFSCISRSIRSSLRPSRDNRLAAHAMRSSLRRSGPATRPRDAAHRPQQSDTHMLHHTHVAFRLGTLTGWTTSSAPHTSCSAKTPPCPPASGRLGQSYTRRGQRRRVTRGSHVKRSRQYTRIARTWCAGASR